MNEKYKDLLTENAMQKGLASRDLMKVVMMAKKYNSPINPQNIKLNKENDRMPALRKEILYYLFAIFRRKNISRF